MAHQRYMPSKDASEFERHILSKKSAGIPLTADERGKLFGDTRPGVSDGSLAEQQYNAELIRRYEAGEPLTIDAKKRARRLIRERKA